MLVANNISNSNAEDVTLTLTVKALIAPLSAISANTLRAIGLIFITEVTTTFPAIFII